MRIVSLLASATEIVCELGLEDRLVGISHECDHPPEVLDRPRVSRPRFDPEGMTSGEVDRAVRRAMEQHGSVYAVDGERLAELDPDLILTQAVCEVCAVPTTGVREVVEETGLDARVLSLDAHTLEEIVASVEAVGRAAGVGDRARGARRRLERRLERVERRVEGVPRPGVLGIEWLDPPFVPGHWVPEMVEAAGGRNLAGDAGERSREAGWDELTGLDPDALLVMPCGFGLEESRAEADAFAGRLREVAPRAVDEGRSWVVDASSYFNRSGPRVVDGVEILAGLLHPDRVEAPPEGTADRWAPPEESAAGPGEVAEGSRAAGEAAT
jgi:iron complex transport system substrate-binding protein